MVAEGCRKYRGRVFRVPRIFRWDYIVSGPALIKEVLSAPESVLSLAVANRDSLQMDLTMGLEVTENPYHLDVVRSKFSRNLGKWLPDIHDELSCAFDETLTSSDTEWKLVAVLPMMMTVVARTTNRPFVGLPICRNQDYQNLVVQNTIDVALRAQLISLLPSILRPILGPLISSRNKNIRKGVKHLGPLIEDRMAQEKKYGPAWPEKPNDYISWLLDSPSASAERIVPNIVMRILATNMAAIHTSSSVFTYALFDLTEYPEYIIALREEAEQVVKELGQCLTAIGSILAYLR
ncbi:cytochrome P450 [Mycena leptocephala]|nr:cytochrome P450 [Mycena leptocephala]